KMGPLPSFLGLGVPWGTVGWMGVPICPQRSALESRGPRCLPSQVFRVEVLCNGRRHTVTKRYSEFQALHNRKTCKVPDFPLRHVPNWMPKALEQRRQGLELYLQGVLYHNEQLPQDVLDFLKVRWLDESCPTSPLEKSSMARASPTTLFQPNQGTLGQPASFPSA
uniref:PX domain-containing protein n=1 Tax=Malurus cyaneus samueli TaxID=2593467 RepID=A0A8C5UEE5_9PASS